MFSGIVEELGTVVSLGPPLDKPEAVELCIRTSITGEGITLGDSIAVNGVCLTVTSLDLDGFSVELSPETLRRTSLGQLQTGDAVNLERSLPAAGRFNGHVVQGHVDGVAVITAIKEEDDALWMTFRAPADILHYVVFKGYLAVNGVSLTVTAVDANSFSVQLVGYTRRHVNLGTAAVGTQVNVEVDVLGKYVEKLLAERMLAERAPESAPNGESDVPVSGSRAGYVPA